MSPQPLAGGCACRAVRYEIEAEPQFAIHCQCRQCQRASGSGHSSLLMVPTAALAVQGELRGYEQLADSGATVTRCFCPVCGSPVLMYSDRFPEGRFVTAASLDDPTAFKPTRVVFHSMAQPWDTVDPALATR